MPGLREFGDRDGEQEDGPPKLIVGTKEAPTEIFWRRRRGGHRNRQPLQAGDAFIIGAARPDWCPDDHLDTSQYDRAAACCVGRDRDSELRRAGCRNAPRYQERGE